jgi:hypothetical protein
MEAKKDEIMNIAPCEVELEVEELEQIIAPALNPNHNESLLTESTEVELEVEELEQIIAPALNPNHNETLLPDTNEVGAINTRS